MKKNLLVFTLLIVTALNLYSEGRLRGKVINKNDNTPLIGASVAILNTKLGGLTNSSGEFEIGNIPAGTYNIRVSYVGFNNELIEVLIKDNQIAKIDIQMTELYLESEAISVIASRAEFRETPVAFSNIAKEDMQMRLGSSELPSILNETPSVYATESGGGYGDSRINIRGFDQRNFAVMINGVPINDMENGWVYWSNWDGIRDIAASIQVQRGLGASRIANPSIGGTMNIITDAARQKAGVSLRQDFGSGNMLSSTIVANSGVMNGLAISFMGKRRTQDGIIDKTWADAWGYYFAVSYDINKDHKLDFYVVGNPQRHGQRSYREPIAKFDKQLALDLGVPIEDVNKFNEHGITYNRHWGTTNLNVVNPNNPMDSIKFTMKEYYMGATHDTYSNDFLNERSNYYHKPQFNINWFWRLEDNTSLTNVFYYSLGQGGGSGTAGPLLATDLEDQINYNFQIKERHFGNIDNNYSPSLNRSVSVLRNSVNNHYWIGWLSTLDNKINDKLRFQGGLDIRYYVGEHFQEVRNLLGGDYYVETIRNSQGSFVDSVGDLNIIADKNQWVRKLGDKIAYNYDGLINWLGGFAQLEYKEDLLSSYLNVSLSNTGYQRKDYFRTPQSINGNITEWQRFWGYTLKAGANYNMTESINIYGNAGYYNRPPMFNVVFNYDNGLFLNPVNEKVLAFELGSGYWSRKFKANVNTYYTNWIDRSFYRSSRDTNQNFIYYNLSGIDALHYGVELELDYRLFSFLRLKGNASIGNWTWTNDVSANIYDESNQLLDTVNIYSKDLKVGNSAQTSFMFNATFYPIKRSFLSIVYKYFMDNYADFEPGSRTSSRDRAQPWKMPDYGLLDAHLGYTFEFNKIDITFIDEIGFKLHFYNILDTKYIADAEDNRNNMIRDKNGVPLHNATSAEVWIGLPFRWSASIELNF